MQSSMSSRLAAPHQVMVTRASSSMCYSPWAEAMLTDGLHSVGHGVGDEKRVADAWQTMTAIKSRILRIWENAATPVKICCIKFAQRVVLAQTASNGSEQKVRQYARLLPLPYTDSTAQRLNGLDVSLSMVPPNHPLLDLRHLEAEATGLLDRMLSVLQDNSR